MNRLAITRMNVRSQEYTAYIALDEKRDFVDFQLFEPETHSLVDQIYIARVEHIIPSIDAAFVWITPEQKCYLPLSDIHNAIFTKKQSSRKLICEGDELLVQIVADGVKTKDPVATPNLTLAGRYCVLTTGNRNLSVSRKLSQAQRTHYHELLKSICSEHETDGYGVVLRTNAAEATDEILAEDVQAQIESLQQIRNYSGHYSAFTRIHQNLPGYIRKMQSTNFTNFDGVYTDDPEIFRNILEYLPFLAERLTVKLYEDPKVSLATLYNLKGNLDKLLNRKIWLPSGGNIVIDTVEAMTVIDVNTAKNSGRHSGVALSVNKEAAVEIARQLRLRNISGIILVDFINMDNKEQKDVLIDLLKKELKKDPVSTQFIDITRLGLVEITRKKIRKSLSEVLTCKRNDADD